MGRKQHQKRQIRRRTISQSTPDDIHAAKSNTTSSRLGQGVSSCQSQRPVDVSETRVRPRTATNQARQRTARSLAAIGSSENTLPHSSAHTGNQAMSAVSPGDFQWPQQNPSHVASHDPLSSHTQARQNHWPQGEPTRYALTIEGHDTPFEGIPVSTNRSFVHSSVIRNLSLHRYQFPTPPNSNFLLHEGTGYQYNPHDCLVVTLKTSERERIRLSIVVIDDSENTVRAAKNCIYLGPDFRNALNAQRHQQYPLPNSMPANLNPAGGMYQTTNPITSDISGGLVGSQNIGTSASYSVAFSGDANFDSASRRGNISGNDNIPYVTYGSAYGSANINNPYVQNALSNSGRPVSSAATYDLPITGYPQFYVPEWQRPFQATSAASGPAVTGVMQDDALGLPQWNLQSEVGQDQNPHQTQGQQY